MNGHARGRSLYNDSCQRLSQLIQFASTQYFHRCQDTHGRQDKTMIVMVPLKSIYISLLILQYSTVLAHLNHSGIALGSTRPCTSMYAERASYRGGYLPWRRFHSYVHRYDGDF